MAWVRSVDASGVCPLRAMPLGDGFTGVTGVIVYHFIGWLSEQENRRLKERERRRLLDLLVVNELESIPVLASVSVYPLPPPSADEDCVFAVAFSSTLTGIRNAPQLQG